MWGNPFRVGVDGDAARVDQFWADCARKRKEDLACYRQWLQPLRGRDLACWCRLDAPCHADVLLNLANE